MMTISLFRRPSKGFKNKYSNFLKALKMWDLISFTMLILKILNASTLFFCLGHENKPLFVFQIFSAPCGIEMWSFSWKGQIYKSCCKWSLLVETWMCATCTKKLTYPAFFKTMCKMYNNTLTKCINKRHV